MKHYTIVRRYDARGTYGEMRREDGTHVAYTVERPRTGAHCCIPEGTYTLSRYDSPKHGPNTWQFDVVPYRTNIQIHVANWPSELLGCIALGNTFGMSAAGEWGVLHSRAAYAAFMEETKNETNITVTLSH